MKGIQHAIEVFVDVGVQPVGADSDDDGNQHRVRSPIAGGAVQQCCGRPSRRSRSTSCAALVHRVGYSIGYSSGAPRLRHVHDVRFRLFIRRRYRGPRRIHSHRPRRGSPSAGARRGERRDHRSISGRYLHPDRKSVTNLGTCSLGICGPQMVPNFELFSVDNHRIVAGQRAFFLVGLAGF